MTTTSVRKLNSLILGGGQFKHKLIKWIQRKCLEKLMKGNPITGFRMKQGEQLKGLGRDLFNSAGLPHQKQLAGSNNGALDHHIVDHESSGSVPDLVIIHK
jgi:hypothetical protein